MGTLLRNRVRLLPVSEVQIESPSWAWLIPLGHSRRSGRMAGYQFCPVCLATDPPYFRWQWSVALCCCCIVHRTLLTDRCPGCASAIHSNPHGLLGALRTLGDDQPFSLERCTNCRFDFRRAQVQLAPESLIQSQSSYENLMRTKGQGTEVIEFFAVLRQIVSLLFGENRGLEELGAKSWRGDQEHRGVDTAKSHMNPMQRSCLSRKLTSTPEPQFSMQLGWLIQGIGQRGLSHVAATPRSATRPLTEKVWSQFDGSSKRP